MLPYCPDLIIIDTSDTRSYRNINWDIDIFYSWFMRNYPKDVLSKHQYIDKLYIFELFLSFFVYKTWLDRWNIRRLNMSNNEILWLKAITWGINHYRAWCYHGDGASFHFLRLFSHFFAFILITSLPMRIIFAYKWMKDVIVFIIVTWS